MKPSAIAAVILSCVLATTTGLSAQLGNIAKKEAERRKTAPTGKVYTNDSLSPAPEPSSAPATSTASSDAPAASDADKAADKSATDKSAADKPADKSATDKPAADTADKDATSKQVSSDPAERKKEEEKWRERMKNARETLDRAKSYSDALQILSLIHI